MSLKKQALHLIYTKTEGLRKAWNLETLQKKKKNPLVMMVVVLVLKENAKHTTVETIV